jgi:oligoendopeptidase F
MARARSAGNGRLEEALQTLIQTQTAFVANAQETDVRIAEMERRIDERFARIDDRFARIEAILLEHSRILQEHTRILQQLTDAIREKIGFKMPPP